MKIIFTVNTYYPLKDGVQMVTEYLAEGLAERGHEVIVITPKYGNIAEEIYNNVKIIRVDIYIKHALYFGDKREYQKLILRYTSDADVIINICTQNPMTDWVFPIMDKILCHKVLYMHGMYNMCWQKSDFTSISNLGHKIWNDFRWRPYYKFSGKYFKKYDRIIQLHQFDRANNYFSEHYGIQSSIIENAVEDVFFSKRQEIETVFPQKYAICVANYLDGKNQEFVLKAFYLANLPDDYELIFIGSEKNKYYMKLIEIDKKLQMQYGYRKVQFLYGIERGKTIQYIENASLFLFGSKSEVYPVVILESMAAGVPYITTNVGCVRYLPGGIIVKNEEDMAYWIGLFALNESVCYDVGKAGYEYIKANSTISFKVNQLENILENLN